MVCLIAPVKIGYLPLRIGGSKVLHADNVSNISKSNCSQFQRTLQLPHCDSESGRVRISNYKLLFATGVGGKGAMIINPVRLSRRHLERNVHGCWIPESYL
jgi:hypothetical protein